MKCRVVSLPVTAPAAMVNLKEENVVVEEVNKSCVELSSSTNEACEMLNRAIKSVCLVCDVQF